MPNKRQIREHMKTALNSNGISSEAMKKYLNEGYDAEDSLSMTIIDLIAANNRMTRELIIAHSKGHECPVCGNVFSS